MTNGINEVGRWSLMMSWKMGRNWSPHKHNCVVHDGTLLYAFIIIRCFLELQLLHPNSFNIWSGVQEDVLFHEVLVCAVRIRTTFCFRFLYMWIHVIKVYVCYIFVLFITVGRYIDTCFRIKYITALCNVFVRWW